MDTSTLVTTVLSNNYIYFKEGDIEWDGEHHNMVGFEVDTNSGRELGLLSIEAFGELPELKVFIDVILDLICLPEEDEGIRVPRNMIAEELHGVIREGDLTGMTLLNLAACNNAFTVQNPAKGSLVVLYDANLSKGIPCFFDLIARMLWDLRTTAYDGEERHFDVTFMAMRNFDFEQAIGGPVERVPGAQDNPNTIHVSEPPIIDLKGSESTSGASSVAKAPLDTMLEAEFYSFLNSIPIEISIEGTHHQGRAERIEKVKAGDELLLKSDWNNEFYEPVAIEVFNSSGSLGYLRIFDPAFGNGNTVLASLIPHIKATVALVTPKSMRSGNAKYALMDVRIELDGEVNPYDGSRDRYIEEGRILLGQPRMERNAESIFDDHESEPKQEAFDEDASNPQKALEKAESSLGWKQKDYYEAISKSGGGVDIFTLSNMVGESIFNPDLIFEGYLTPMIEEGLVIEVREPDQTGDPGTICRRYYTWRQKGTD